jgi:hypothetical protein
LLNKQVDVKKGRLICLKHKFSKKEIGLVIQETMIP